MSNANPEYDPEEILNSKGKVFVLFYASWCHFSRSFLPVFGQFAQDKNRSCTLIETDNNESLCEKYSVDVLPTVIVFENGKVIKRLDGIWGIGVTEKQFKDFIKNC
jgi:thiol-disulfide isomerase/thioredoxin